MANITLAAQNMKDGSTKLKLVSPYHPSLPADARALGGQWNATTKAWYFDQRDADRVRALCLKHFGVDPLADAPADLVTVRLNLDAYSDGAELWVFGRQVAGRLSRDQSVRLGEGVVLLSGGFPLSGGSTKNPRLDPEKGTVLEVRDVPRNLFESALEAQRAEIARLREVAAVGGYNAPWNAKRADELEANIVQIIEDAPPAEPVATAEQQILALWATLSPERRAKLLEKLAPVASVGANNG